MITGDPTRDPTDPDLHWRPTVRPSSPAPRAATAPTAAIVAASTAQPRWRGLAALGAVLTVTGCLVLVQLGALTLAKSYLSHLGARGEPTAARFQVGLMICAVGVVAVAVALWRLGQPRLRVLGLSVGSAAVLLVSGVCLGLTAAVPCSPGCPLPPYGVPTTSDWVHATVAVGAFVAASAVMIIFAVASRDRWLRWSSLATGVVVAGAAGLGALFALVDVPSDIGGSLERVASGAGLLWLVLVAVRLATTRSASRPLP